LSHPLIVDAAQTLFVPACVYNNVKGADARVLERFEEPASNNPVVRIVSGSGDDLVPRIAGRWTIDAVAHGMMAALAKAGRKPPEWLRLLADEHKALRRGTESAVFGMACFWTGEAEFGRIDGVVGTRPGVLDGDEVVEVRFDPEVISYRSLLDRAASHECANRVFTRSDAQQAIASKKLGKRAVRSDEPIRPDKQPKYHLSGTPLRFVPMTELQATRINARIGHGDFEEILSPSQLDLLRRIRANPKAGWQPAIGKPLLEAWSAAQRTAANAKRAPEKK